MEDTFFISTLIGMRPEVVSLCLNQVCRQNSRAIAIIISNSSGESWDWNTILYSIGHNIAQGLLILVSNFFEIWR